MIGIVEYLLKIINWFFLFYLMIYATYLLCSVTTGAWKLYYSGKMRRINNEIRHEFYFPVSILVPAYNEEVTIVDSIESLLCLNYRLYEIIIVDDGSSDDTVKVLKEHFHMRKIQRPIRKQLPCEEERAVYVTEDCKVPVTLICKGNGGKGDALNMGINAAGYPYFLCIDADSMLQADSLEKIVQPVMETDHVVAVGGLVRSAQSLKMRDGKPDGYQMPWNLVTGMQIMEYDRSFLAARILLDRFNGNLIISGAFGLFKKDVVIAAGGYDRETLGEDMELVVRLHVFCKNNKIPYSIRYEPDAVCWSQVPESLNDLRKQRRRWHLGLFQSMMKHRKIFMNPLYGWLGAGSYLYYLLYELLSPFIQLAGWVTMGISAAAEILNWNFMIAFYLLYTMYNTVLTLTIFFQRVYTLHLRIHIPDVIKAIIVCTLENVFFRLFLDMVRVTAFIGYRKKKKEWGSIRRVKQNGAYNDGRQK